MERTSNTEITAQALGGAIATLIVLATQWVLDMQAPAGLEGALAVITATAVMLVRNQMVKSKDCPPCDTGEQ